MKRRFAGRSVSVVLSLLLAAQPLLLVACGGHARGPSLPAGQTSVSGRIVLPEGSPVSVSSLTVSTSSDLGRAAGADGSFSVLASANSSHLVMARDEAGSPWLLTISTGSSRQPEGLTIDATSTAASLVFLCPFIAVTDPVAGQTLLGQIRALPETQALAGQISAALAAGTNPLSSPTYSLQQALRTAVGATVSALTTPQSHGRSISIAPQGPHAGITLTSTDEPSLDTSQRQQVPLEARNAKFRFLSAYSVPFDIYDQAAESERWLALVGSAVSAQSSISLAVAILTNQSADQVQGLRATGPRGSARYEISFYGPGAGMDLTDTRYWAPFGVTTIFNGVMPVVSVIIGLEDVTHNKTAAKLVADFALEELDKAGAVASAVMDVGIAAQGRDWLGVALALGDLAWEFAVDLVSTPEGQRTLLDIAAALGISLAIDVVKEAVKLVTFVLKVWDLIGGIIDVVRVVFDTVTTPALQRFQVTGLEGGGNVVITAIGPGRLRALATG